MENTLKNKYVRRAKITEAQFRKMIKYFVEDLSATQIAEKIELNRNTVNRYLNEIRVRITEFCDQCNPFHEELKEEQLATTVEADNDHKSTITEKISNNLGFIKRRGKVYAEMIANLSPNKLQNLIKGNIETKDIAVHSIDVQEDYGLVAVGYDNNKNLAGKPSYVDDLNKFWSFAKDRTAKFQGVAKHKFYMHLKECEFRFNFRNDNLYSVILKMLATKPIS